MQPSWWQDKACRHNDKEKIFKELDNNGISKNKVILVFMYRKNVRSLVIIR
ncbi:MAG: hypothetical protein U0457_16445 [Candidatus Sericytochromatia bacterium]